MAPNDSAQITGENGEHGAAGELPADRRRAARYVVPVAVAAVTAATIGLVPALAASGDPDLPKISAQELIEKIAASDTERLSGTVKIRTDLGIPSLGGLGGSTAGSFAPKGGAGDGAEGGSAAEPTGRLMELASGEHTLRVAADGPGKQRVSILDSAAEYSLIHNAGEVWAYDSASNEAYHAKAPAGAKGAEKGGEGKDQVAPKGLPATPQDFAREALEAAGDTTSVTVDGTARIAGRDAYQLVIKPKQEGSTVGSVKVAVDSETGTPLKFTLSPSSGGKAAIDVGFTEVDFSKPAASTFDFSPPKGAKVTEADEAKAAGRDEALKAPKDAKDLGAGAEPNVIGEGWTAVVQLDTGTKNPAAASEDMPAQAREFMDALGDKVEGKFGSGTVFKTRLVNALMTDDGKVYVGAVTKDALVKAANEAK